MKYMTTALIVMSLAVSSQVLAQDNLSRYERISKYSDQMALGVACTTVAASTKHHESMGHLMPKMVAFSKERYSKLKKLVNDDEELAELIIDIRMETAAKVLVMRYDPDTCQLNFNFDSLFGGS